MPGGHGDSATHIQLKLMKLSIAHLFHSPTGMLISCGPPRVLNHHTHAHTHIRIYSQRGSDHEQRVGRGASMGARCSVMLLVG